MSIRLRHIILCTLLCVIQLLPTHGWAQSDDEAAVVGNTQREEIQRYFGYEILPYRYLSLPFDLSVNSNEGGVFVDIGFLYFAFLPFFVLLFLLRSQRYKLFWGFLGTLLLVWIVGVSNSYFYSHTDGLLKSDEANNMVDYLLGPVSFQAEPLAHFVAYVYYVASLAYQPLLSLASLVSGDADVISYPGLVFLFLLSCLVLMPVLKKVTRTHKFLVIVFWIFFFFWIKFSAGIVWYGFPVLVIALLIIATLIQKFDQEPTFSSKVLKYFFIAVSSIWILSAVLFRLGEVHNGGQVEDLGKGMFSPWFFKYQTGETSEAEIIEAFYPEFNKTLAKMNGESTSKIWRVGSSFSYFIRNNSERILIDNQLGLFNRTSTYYNGNQQVINDVLKASDFKYIIVDVNTPYIDKTPEQTLKKKYDVLMKYVRRNKGLRLLCTNRIFQEKDPRTGKVNLYYKMFPTKGRESKIFYGGQYAVYEIL